MLHFILSLIFLPICLLVASMLLPNTLTEERIVFLHVFGYIFIGAFYFRYFARHYKLRQPFHPGTTFKEAGLVAHSVMSTSAGLVVAGVIVLIILLFG